MYPREELAHLGRQKAALRLRVAANREECRIAAGHATRPLVLLDRIVALGRWFLPLVRSASGPAAVAAACAGLFRTRPMRTLFTWGPIAFGIWRTLSRLWKDPEPKSKEPPRA